MDVGAIKGLLDLVKLGRKALKRLGAFLCRAELERMKREIEAVEDRAEKAEREVRRIQLECLEKADKLAAQEREACRRAGFALVSFSLFIVLVPFVLSFPRGGRFSQTGRTAVAWLPCIRSLLGRA